MNKYTLSVVVPAYNEEAVIYDNLQSITESIDLFCQNYEVIVVNDGSSDQTFSEVMRARTKNPRIKLVNYRVNRGKGGAIKEGVSHATGKYIAFLDADLDLAADHLEDFFHAIIDNNADIVIGSKLHKDSVLNYPFSRRIMSYGYYCLLRLLFHLNIKDTQTGIKLFKAEVIQPIVKQLTTSGYAFDIEILVRASQLGFGIIEMPVHLNYTRGMENGMTRIRIKDVFTMFFDTLKIFWKLRIDK